MNRRRRAQLTVALCALILLVPVGVAVAQVATHQASAGTPYQTISGVTVTLGDQRDVQSVPFDGDNTFNDSTLRISGSNADIRITDNTYSSDPVSARTIDVRGSLTIERTDINRQITIEDGDANLLQVRDYAVGDGSEDLAYDSDGGLTVTFTGLPAVGVAAVDADTGTPIQTTAVDQSGEATFELPAGTNSIRLEETPSDLEVRNEAQPSQLIDGNVTLRARLFSGDEVIERQVTDGTVSLDGVPTDRELIVTVKEENADFVYRRILLESAVQTDEIYLLPTSDPSAEVEFNLRDDTGRFQADNTKLFVEKPITRDFDSDGTNETQYQTISGDRIGGDGAFPTILEDSERYRLRVVNDDGEQRVLGSYTVQGAERTTLPIGEVTFREDVDEGAALQANLREAADGASYDHEVRLTYIDPEAQTESIDISITDSDGNTIRPESTENITADEAYVETYPITDTSFDPTQDTATVTVEALRDNQIETFERKLGDVPDVFTQVPLSTQAIELLSLGSIVAVFGLLAIISGPLAALVGTGYAGLLSLVGLAPIPMPAVVLAGLIGVIATVGSRRV
jgi:hypothetical protein